MIDESEETSLQLIDIMKNQNFCKIIQQDGELYCNDIDNKFINISQQKLDLVKLLSQCIQSQEKVQFCFDNKFIEILNKSITFSSLIIEKQQKIISEYQQIILYLTSIEENFEQEIRNPFILNPKKQNWRLCADQMNIFWSEEYEGITKKWKTLYDAKDTLDILNSCQFEEVRLNEVNLNIVSKIVKDFQITQYKNVKGNMSSEIDFKNIEFNFLNIKINTLSDGQISCFELALRITLANSLKCLSIDFIFIRMNNFLYQIQIMFNNEKSFIHRLNLKFSLSMFENKEPFNLQILDQFIYEQKLFSEIKIIMLTNMFSTQQLIQIDKECEKIIYFELMPLKPVQINYIKIRNAQNQIKHQIFCFYFYIQNHLSYSPCQTLVDLYCDDCNISV